MLDPWREIEEEWNQSEDMNKMKINAWSLKECEEEWNQFEDMNKMKINAWSRDSKHNFWFLLTYFFYILVYIFTSLNPVLVLIS